MCCISICQWKDYLNSVFLFWLQWSWLLILICLINITFSPQCLIIGGGPCGLRTAIELALLGCKVVVIEKRDTFSRNNVLHLWPYTIQDLRGLGAKKFYGKFCAGSIDHISECSLHYTCITLEHDTVANLGFRLYLSFADQLLLL